MKKKQQNIDLSSMRGAIFSKGGNYRYLLWRKWGSGTRYCMFIGLNPSKAGADTDDHTIRRCMSFAKASGFDGFYMVNLYAWVSTEAAAILTIDYPIGELNDHHLLDGAMECEQIIACWGWHPIHKRKPDGGNHRWLEVLKMLDLPVMCLGKTIGGHPRHPSRLPNSAKMEIFWSPGDA